MCYSPIDVINPSKYVSLKFRDRYVMQVPCGKCAQCLTAKSNEWSYRLFHHALDTFKEGFVLFDTLTYDNAHLPHISDYISVSTDVDFPCFSSRDLRLFVADLRQRCKRQFKSNFSYFIASEYGTDSKHLHRPHYHALFFVKGNVSPLDFSMLVAKTWGRGRTDGLPYKPSTHVLENTFRDMSAGALRSLKYVCKYIQKSSLFQKTIDMRLRHIMADISSTFVSQGLDDWPNSSHFWRVRDSIARKINQFHRQSTFLGASVLGDLDLNEVFNTGQLYMPDNEFVVKSIPLPTYFKRKLFYKLVEIDGAKSWQPTELGLQYLKFREKFQISKLADRFHAVATQFRLNVDVSKLADYVYNYRGRFRSFFPPSTLSERLSHLSFFNYVTRYDKEQFDSLGLSSRFMGNSSIGYSRSKPAFLPLSSFISQHVYFNQEYETVLSTIFHHSNELGLVRQNAFSSKQRLQNLIHHFYP